MNPSTYPFTDELPGYYFAMDIDCSPEHVQHLGLTLATKFGAIFMTAQDISPENL